MNENQTTLGAVANSQANISTTATPDVAEQTQPAQPVQPEQQNTVANDNWTWTSSWDVTQTAQNSEALSDTELLKQVDEIINESKTLETVAKETDEANNQKENEDALAAIVKEETKDIPSDNATDVNTEASDSVWETDKLDEELKQWLEDIKDKKTAEDMAKKLYLAFQKERSIHQFDNEQNKNTIDVLKSMVKKLNEQVTTTDNDPRVQKLDDEFYTLWKLEQSFKKDKSESGKKNLTRFYVAKLAVLNPQLNANQIMETFANAPLKSNTMWEGTPASAPVAEVKKPAPTPSWIPMSRRGMY